MYYFGSKNVDVDHDGIGEIAAIVCLHMKTVIGPCGDGLHAHAKCQFHSRFGQCPGGAVTVQLGERHGRPPHIARIGLIKQNRRVATSASRSPMSTALSESIRIFPV